MRRSQLLRSFASALGFLVLLSGSAQAQRETLEDRITRIMNQMTIGEKILQLHQEGGFNTADNTRLKIPGFVMADGPHGVRDGLATAFPTGISMAATWDRALVERIGIGMGKEFRGKGKHQALGPCLDLDRDPRNGRSPESGGEDPYLCAQITSAVTRGIQSTGAIATIKHYNANHREQNRYTNNVTISRRWLNEHYGLAFRTSVQQSGALCVMNAYNLINGEKCAENSMLLSSILKDAWGFPFYVVSDWDSIFDTEKAIDAGCDICMGSDKYKNDLPGLVSTGKVSVATIDRAVRRVLRTKFAAGMMDYIPDGDPADVNSQANQQLCLEAGRKTIVLLKNEGNLLPLNAASLTSVALVGPSAAYMQIDGGGSGYVTPFYSVSPKAGLEAKLGAGKVLYAKGCDINSSDTSGFAGALSAARTSDVVIYCGGLDPSQEGEGFDRAGGSTALPGKQQDLINALARENKNVVVVLFSGGVCNTARSIANIKSLLYAFYPSQEGGNAVADVLVGDVNPGGKLPVTIPMSDAQLAPWTGNDDFNTDWGCGYRWFDKKGLVPQFPFGFGLSYTTFAYSNLSISPKAVAPGVPVTVSVDVENTGSRAGDEVVELYLTRGSSSLPMPVKELRGFERVTLKSGEKKTVSIALTADELYVYDETNLRFDVEPGTYTVRVGGSSDNLPMTGTFDVTGDAKKPDLLITSVKMVPPYPHKGDKVLFLATVKNQGSAASAPGAKIKTVFSVNGTEIAHSDTAMASGIPAGGMALICADQGVSADSSNTWTAGDIGTYTVDAKLDPENTIDECVETNNARTASLTVYPQPRVNLALNKTVTVSSVEASGLEGSKAVDGNYGTRWSSAFSDPQFITVDLGASTYISDIVISWEAAYATTYHVQTSENGVTWTTVKTVTDGNGGTVKFDVGWSGRYVRVYGVKRVTVWGYSIYEIVVHGDTPTPVKAENGNAKSTPDHFSLSQNSPNPFNPSTVIRYAVPARSRVRIDVMNILGQRVAELVDGEREAGTYECTWNAAGASSGVYFYRIDAVSAERGAERFVSTKKMLLMR